MDNLEYRLVRIDETEKIAGLLKNTHSVFDIEFITRFFNPVVSPKSVLFGCFQNDQLLGLRGLYAYKLFSAGTIKDAATSGFVMTDKSLRGKGMGLKLHEESTKYCPDYLSFFIDFKLSKKPTPLKSSWTDSCIETYGKCGFHSKQLSETTPVFRPCKKILTGGNDTNRPMLRTKRLSIKDSKDIIRFAENYYSRYPIAELPDENSIMQLDLYPDKYHWFSVDHEDKRIGYISCYQFLFHKDDNIQKQIHFQHLMVDEAYLADAVNAVISELEHLDYESDLYVINNSSILNKEFLKSAGFMRGFSKFQFFLSYRCEDSFLMDMPDKAVNPLPFSITVI